MSRTFAFQKGSTPAHTIEMDTAGGHQMMHLPEKRAYSATNLSDVYSSPEGDDEGPSAMVGVTAPSILPNFQGRHALAWKPMKQQFDAPPGGMMGIRLPGTDTPEGRDPRVHQMVSDMTSSTLFTESPGQVHVIQAHPEAAEAVPTMLGMAHNDFGTGDNESVLRSMNKRIKMEPWYTPHSSLMDNERGLENVSPEVEQRANERVTRAVQSLHPDQFGAGDQASQQRARLAIRRNLPYGHPEGRREGPQQGTLF